MDAHVVDVGKAGGLAFNYDRVLVTPKTRRAHRLVGWAQERGDASHLVHEVFHSYFTEGRDIGSVDVLADVGAAAGFPRREVEEGGRRACSGAPTLCQDFDGAPRSASGGGVGEVQELEARSLALGTHGVPHIRIGRFVAEGAVAVPP
jgi:protein-disulfide isomerase-like protein with CxxC motif